MSVSQGSCANTRIPSNLAPPVSIFFLKCASRVVQSA